MTDSEKSLREAIAEQRPKNTKKDSQLLSEEGLYNGQISNAEKENQSPISLKK